jgi:hypothetical protein
MSEYPIYVSVGRFICLLAVPCHNPFQCADNQPACRPTNPPTQNNNFWHLPLDQAALKGVPNKPGATAAPTPSPNGGMAAGLNAYTGEILWSFANPMPQLGDATKNALSQAPMTVANGEPLGCLIALSPSTHAPACSAAPASDPPCLHP